MQKDGFKLDLGRRYASDIESVRQLLAGNLYLGIDNFDGYEQLHLFRDEQPSL